MTKKINILIGADLVPTKTNEDLFSSTKIKDLLGNELITILSESDARIFNLETPLIVSETPIKKCGPVLGANISTINGIKKMNPTFLTLANNHIMDHGEIGLNTTINTLKENNIEFGGVGNNLQDMNKIWIKEIEGIKIGIYSCCEHEFSIATEFNAGANPFNPLQSYNDIKEAYKLCDYLIVLYHGGKELYPYPSPNLQKSCQKFIDCGADFVVCQHSHCIGCEETYKDKKIVYGQGNFLFDRSNIKEWNNGLLINIEISNNHKLENLKYIVLEKKQNTIRIADEMVREKILKEFKQRSEEIKDSQFVLDNYERFSYGYLFKLLQRFDLLSNCFLFKVLNKLTKKKLEKWYFNKIYLRKNVYKLLNALECEAWREMVISGLKEYINDSND